MTSKRSLSISPIRALQILNSSSKLDVCLICGDKARNINYGALSCLSCKTFFRRHGFHPKNVSSCYNQGNCSVTIQSRKCCIGCRFAKCLAMGMTSELIRKEDLHKKNRSAKKLVSKEISLPQPRLLNLLSADQSSLTSENWRLLSNVIHAFDTYNSISATQKITQSITIDFEHTKPNFETALNIIELSFSSLQSLINRIADFRVMTSSEQCSMLQRNMQGLLAFYCTVVFRESGVYGNNKAENVIIPLYGYQSVQTGKNISTRLEYDLTLVKLMLIILTFSSNCFMIDEADKKSKDSFLYGTFRLFGSQNVYTELLWKYMTYKYGYWGAVRHFSCMIKTILDSLRLSADIYDSNKIHREFAEDIVEQFEHELTLNSFEHDRLWGR